LQPFSASDAVFQRGFNAAKYIETAGCICNDIRAYFKFPAYTPPATIEVMKQLNPFPNFFSIKVAFIFMKETEVKVLEIDRNKVIEKILAQNGKLLFDGEVSTLFLDFLDNQIYRRKDVLRLRKEKNTTEMTYKKVRFEGGVKVAEEISVQISSLEDATAILQNLGLTVKEMMNKHRTSYQLGNARIDIDKYQGEYAFIPEFLEIEAPKDSIAETAMLLGFQKKDCLPWSTDELIGHYASKENRAIWLL
jgi:predicted adenylyl cyclase CyaB